MVESTSTEAGLNGSGSEEAVKVFHSGGDADDAHVADALDTETASELQKLAPKLAKQSSKKSKASSASSNAEAADGNMASTSNTDSSNSGKNADVNKPEKIKKATSANAKSSSRRGKGQSEKKSEKFESAVNLSRAGKNAGSKVKAALGGLSSKTFNRDARQWLGRAKSIAVSLQNEQERKKFLSDARGLLSEAETRAQSYESKAKEKIAETLRSGAKSKAWAQAKSVQEQSQSYLDDASKKLEAITNRFGLSRGDQRSLSASSLVGDQVKNKEGDQLGKLEDLMLDTKSGKISYAVVSLEGDQKPATRFYAVPWSAVKVNREDKAVVFDVSKEKLKDAPGFDRGHWPNTGDKKWVKEVESYYNL